MSILKIKNTLLSSSVLVMGAVFALVFSFIGANKVSAAPVANFNPGYIISDNIFTNHQSMTAAQIQDFLKSKVPVCDTWGTKGSTSTARRDFIRSYGYDVPLKCLIDYTENGKSAAQIIYDTAQKYQINPQVFIVLLQKEQGLVTDDWPGPWQYKTATGYGCPDTAPCDSQYYGLTNQLDWAGKMYRAIMNVSPTWYTPYILGNNYIRYNPVASCGGTTVNILNRATQALYNYTPYQPNQSALNAGYGSGDSCGAYGNRNFYLYFSDWFGSPQYGNLVRTASNATVYLVSGDIKYPIPNMDTLVALGPLGGVTFVPQSYVDSKSTGPLMGRFIKSKDGTVFFYDAGIKLPFSSCSLVEDYGSDCGQVVPLEDGQISLLSNGPVMTNLFGTTSGKVFYIDNGKKHEAYDTSSLTQAGITGIASTLHESAINYIPYGNPVVRSNVVVLSRSSEKKYLYSNDTYYVLSDTQINYSYIKLLPHGKLDDNSLLTGLTSISLNGFIKDATTGSEYVLMPQGKVQLTDPLSWGTSSAVVDGSLITVLPNASDPINNGIVMTPGDGTVYYVTGGERRPVAGWGNLLDLKIEPLVINTIDGPTMKAIPTGPLIYAPGHMVKTANSATVYIVKSYTELLPISSFKFPQELGASAALEIMSDADFSEYTIGDSVRTKITCGGKNYVGTNGKAYLLSASDLARLGFEQSDFIDAGMLCEALPKSVQSLPDFLLDSTGTIYLVRSGIKYAFAGYGAYLAHSGSPQNTLRVSNYFTSLIPSGANISQ